MLLAVDVGNTQTHLGAFDGELLAEHWRFQTRSGATGDELAERISGLLGLCGMGLDDLDAVCVSSVVPPLGTQYEQLTERYMDADCLPIGPGVRTGMPIRIDNPLEVGADRLMFASDYPWETMEDAVEFMDKAPLADADREKIEWRNAAKLFGLEVGAAETGAA